MLKVKFIGDSYALLSGGCDPGESGMLAFRLPAGESVASLLVNGSAYSASGAVCRVPVTAFKTGSNRLSVRLTDGGTIPAEGVRLTGGLFSPEGASVPDVIAACDKRFSALSRRIADLTERVKTLEEDTGILP